MTRMMKDMVQIQGGFKPSVLLPDDFCDESTNQHFVSTYIPTNETLDIFMSVRDSLQVGSEHRARLFSGTYGTGKSDLMLMIANYVTRNPDDALLQPFFERLRRLNDAKAEAIRQARSGRPPFLLVLLQSDTAVTFSSFVLDGLARKLERVGLLHLMGHTYYRAALDLVESWEPDRPENCQRLGQVLEQDYGITLEGLKRDLEGPRADPALEIFRQAVQKAIGMPFHPTAVIQRPADAFVEVAQRLVDSEQYSGVFVICDEFTHLMQRLAESPTAADSKAIDNLAERAVRSGRHQLHLMVVSLESFASARGSTQLAQEALERSGGRFILRELKSQDVEELISASIAKLVPPGQLFQGMPSQRDDLLALAMKLWGEREERRRNQGWIHQIVVQGAFPLHPLATYCLQRLNAALAQNERTMFSFLWDQDCGLNHFIQSSSGEPSATGWVPLMSLADLYGYFEPNLKEKRPDLVLAYSQARATLGEEWLGTNIDDNILRALVLLEVVSDPRLRADRTLLRHALALSPADDPQLGDALTQLEQALVVYKDQAGRYRMVLPGRANPLELKRLIEKRARELPGSPVEMLNSLHELQPVTAATYNRTRGTSRQVAARFVSPAGLSSPATVIACLKGQDGAVLYVVSASEQELKDARAQALQLTRDNDRIVITVPSQPTELIATYQRRRALEDVRSSPEHEASDFQDLLVDTGLVGEDYTKAFERSREAFDKPGNFEWYRKGRTVDVRSPQHLDALATALMNDVFPQTPPHGMAQHLKSSGSSKNVRDAVGCILQAPFKLEPTRRGRMPARDAILREGAQPLGLVSHVNDAAGFEVFDVVIPGSSTRYSKEIWTTIEERLRAGDEWKAIVAGLGERPYGLYPSVLQLFVAAFYHFNRDFLELREVGRVERRSLDVTAPVVEQLVLEPDKFVLRYQPLSVLQRSYLRGLVERALYPGRPLRDLGDAGAALRNRVGQALRLWWTEQQRGVCGIVGQATVDELESILTNCPPETIEAAVALVGAALQPDAPATASALQEELPYRLGLATDPEFWTEDQVEHALAIAESACAALRAFSRDFRAHMAWRVGELFGLVAPPADWNDALKMALTWRQHAAKSVPATSLDRDARDLLFVLDEDPSSFEQAFLNALASRFGMLPYSSWKTMSVRDRYLERLAAAKASVEQMATSLRQRPSFAGRVTETTTVNQPNQVPGQAPLAAVKEKEALPIRKETVATGGRPPAVSGTGPTPVPGVGTTAVEQAFAEVEPVFNKLIPQDRHALLRRLRQKYDPL